MSGPFFSKQQIDQALTQACGICRQPAGKPCRDLRGELIAQLVHHYRVEA